MGTICVMCIFSRPAGALYARNVTFHVQVKHGEGEEKLKTNQKTCTQAKTKPNNPTKMSFLFKT